MISPTVIATSASLSAARAARAREEEEENQNIINAVEGTPSIKINKTMIFNCACGKEYKVAVLMRPDTGAAEHGHYSKAQTLSMGLIGVLILIIGIIAGYMIAKS